MVSPPGQGPIPPGQALYATYVDAGSFGNELDGSVGRPRDTLEDVVVFSQLCLALGSTDDPDTRGLVVATAEQ